MYANLFVALVSLEALLLHHETSGLLESARFLRRQAHVTEKGGEADDERRVAIRLLLDLAADEYSVILSTCKLSGSEKYESATHTSRSKSFHNTSSIARLSWFLSLWSLRSFRSPYRCERPAPQKRGDEQEKSWCGGFD